MDDFFLDDDLGVVDPSFLIDPDLMMLQDSGSHAQRRHHIFDIRSATPTLDQQQQQQRSFMSEPQHNRFDTSFISSAERQSVEGTPSKRKGKTLALKEQEKVIRFHWLTLIISGFIFCRPSTTSRRKILAWKWRFTFWKRAWPSLRRKIWRMHSRR